MANRNFNRVQALPKELKILSGIVKIVGATDPANAVVTLEPSNNVGITSVARSGTGEYTITLDDKYTSLFNANFNLEAATAIDLVPQIKSHDVASAKTLVVNLNAGATPTDSANEVVHKIHFNLILKNSSAR